MTDEILEIEKTKRRKRNWAKNREILKSIPNPSGEAYEIKMKIPELTSLHSGLRYIRTRELSMSFMMI